MSISAPPLAAVIPYFGSFPVYWPLTLYTMGRNREVDWHLFTDQRVADPPANVIVHPTTFLETVARIQAALDLPVRIDDPYKLCDFKPAYGLVYAAELSPYDYWAYADVDVVWGRIWNHIAAPVSAKTDRVLTLGHLSFLRNDPALTNAFEREVPGVRTARTAFTTVEHFSFDEFGGWNDIAEQTGIDTFSDAVYFDMHVDSYRLAANRSRRIRRDSVFAWSDGRCLELERRSGRVLSESAYIHLQKRAMRLPRTPVPPATAPNALAFGPVDIVAAPDLVAAAWTSAALERSLSSRWHWGRNYWRFRMRRALRRLKREFDAKLFARR